MITNNFRRSFCCSSISLSVIFISYKVPPVKWSHKTSFFCVCLFSFPLSPFPFFFFFFLQERRFFFGKIGSEAAADIRKNVQVEWKGTWSDHEAAPARLHYRFRAINRSRFHNIRQMQDNSRYIDYNIVPYFTSHFNVNEKRNELQVANIVLIEFALTTFTMSSHDSDTNCGYDLI